MLVSFYKENIYKEKITRQREKIHANSNSQKKVFWKVVHASNSQTKFPPVPKLIIDNVSVTDPVTSVIC